MPAKTRNENNVQQFQKSLKDFADTIGADVTDVVKKLALDAYSGIVIRTPVDTGRARASWVVQVANSPEVVIPTTWNAQASEQEAKQEIEGIDSPNQAVWITNSLPYIKPLEFGSSVQAPNGMVTITFNELVRDIEAIATAS